MQVVPFCFFKKYSRKDANKDEINGNNAANSDFIRSNDRTLPQVIFHFLTMKSENRELIK